MRPSPALDVSATEKPVRIASATSEDKAGVALKGKANVGETVPGWTIMRPLKMRGLKGRDRDRLGSGDISTSTSEGGNRASDNKSNGDLKVTETNGTIASGGGDIDALHEIRSDDELLGSDSDEGGPRRAPGARGTQDGAGDNGTIASSEIEFKVYKRRWFGLVQLVLLNIIASWDVSATPFQAVSQPP